MKINNTKNHRFFDMYKVIFEKVVEFLIAVNHGFCYTE